MARGITDVSRALCYPYQECWQALGKTLVGDTLQERYSLRSLISAGRHHAEFAADAEGKPLSVTVIEADELDFDRQLAQIQIARTLAHPNLLRVVDGGEWSFGGNKLLFVVTETVPATLTQVIAQSPLDPTEATALTKDLLDSLEYLHNQGFVCGSLEPDTVVRAGAHWKLGDLSQLHRPGGLEDREPAGPNRPPEASLGSIGPGWDVWALGATLRAVLAAQVRRRPEFDAIIAGCLEPDPTKRISTAGIRRLLDKADPARVSAAPKAVPAGELPTPRRGLFRIPVVAAAFAALLLVVVLA